MRGTRVIGSTLLGVVIAAGIILGAPRAVIDTRWRLRMAAAGERHLYVA